MNTTSKTQIEQALATERLIDITTIGRKTGQSRRIEMLFHKVDGTLYLTGSPGKRRHWYENLLANPDFTFHLKQSVTADLPARATPVRDEAERRRILAVILAGMPDHRDELETWAATSPLVRVELIAAT
jgi:deazaflavin-dependent oxidoreductase (nitroreductase family)